MSATAAWVRFLLLFPLTACHRAAKDYGPPPPAEHQALVRTAMDGVFDARYRLEHPSDYRFAAPVQDRVAYWLFEPEAPPGRSQTFGYLYGWCVEFWVTPHYRGYPAQPESHRMAFFGDGRLRGLFAAGLGNAPLDLDKWSPDWTDRAWAATKAPGRAVRGGSDSLPSSPR